LPEISAHKSRSRSINENTPKVYDREIQELIAKYPPVKPKDLT